VKLCVCSECTKCTAHMNQSIIDFILTAVSVCGKTFKYNQNYNWWMLFHLKSSYRPCYTCGEGRQGALPTYTNLLVCLKKLAAICWLLVTFKKWNFNATGTGPVLKSTTKLCNWILYFSQSNPHSGLDKEAQSELNWVCVAWARMPDIHVGQWSALLMLADYRGSQRS